MTEGDVITHQITEEGREAEIIRLVIMTVLLAIMTEEEMIDLLVMIVLLVTMTVEGMIGLLVMIETDEDLVEGINCPFALIHSSPELWPSEVACE